MKAHELTRTKFTGFRLKHGRLLWTGAYMHGDRRRVCIHRTVNGKTVRRYVSPHAEVTIC